MKIYVGHSNEIDYKNELYLPIRKSSLNDKYNFILPHEKSKEPFNSKDFLKCCDLFIAEVSAKSTGLGIELGWADLLGVPIICFHKNDVRPSSSLKVITNEFIEYENDIDFIHKISNSIKKIHGTK